VKSEEALDLPVGNKKNEMICSFGFWYHVDLLVNANVSVKCWHLPTSLHGAKTQKKNINILTAVET
jgi:hypothetical protein